MRGDHTEMNGRAQEDTGSLQKWLQERNQNFFLVIEDEPRGPFTREEVASKLQNGEIQLSHYCRPVEGLRWETVSNHIQSPFVQEDEGRGYSRRTVRMRLDKELGD